jgi:hypothetical protein
MTSFTATTTTSTKKSITQGLITPLTALSLFFMLFGLSPRVVYAYSRGDAGMGFERAEILRRPAYTPKVRVEGELAYSTENNGEQVLNIKDNQTGKTYRLSGDNETAKQFFKNGTKKVAIEGTVSGDSTLNVQKTEAF